MAGLAALGGGGTSLAALGGGLLAGALGGAILVGSGAVQFNEPAGVPSGMAGLPAAEGIVVILCPDKGPPAGTIARGQPILVTGRTADNRYVQVHWPIVGTTGFAYVPAGPIRAADGRELDLASLRIVSCEAPAVVTTTTTSTTTAATTTTTSTTSTAATTTTTTTTTSTTSTAATTTTTTTRSTTTTKTEKPTPSPAPKPNTPPKVSGLKASTSTISYDQGDYCPTAKKTVTISVSATDSDGIASVTLYWRKPGASGYASRAMTLSGGRYVATLDTKADGISKAGKLQYYVVARDANSNQKSTRSPASGSLAVTVKVCANPGPEITLLRASPTSIVTDPLGVGCKGVTLSQVTAQANDSDGVKSLQLAFKKPGATAYTTRSFTLDGDTWYSFIDTAPSADNIRTPGTISWYVVATDTKGARTKSGTSTITVTKCDSPATFYFGALTNPYNADCGFGSTMQQIPISASDPDAPTGQLDITVAWVARGLRGVPVYQGSTAAPWNGELYVAAFSISGWVATGYTLEWQATSRDPAGGISKSQAAKGQFRALACPPPTTDSLTPGALAGGRR